MDLDDLIDDIIGDEPIRATGGNRNTTNSNQNFSAAQHQSSSHQQVTYQQSNQQNSQYTGNQQFQQNVQPQPQQYRPKYNYQPMNTAGNDNDDNWDESSDENEKVKNNFTANQQQTSYGAGQAAQSTSNDNYAARSNTFQEPVDDLDDLLNEFAGDVKAEQRQKAAMQLQPTASMQYSSGQQSMSSIGQGFQRAQTISGNKCSYIFIGGSSLADGQTIASYQPMSCSSLRCSMCDKRVVRFADNVKWSASVDYLFVRNFNTSVDRLREGVEPAPGFSCYACQCQFVSLDDASKPVNDFSQLRWHCRGH